MTDSKKSSSHDIVQSIKNLASELGRAPNRDEFRARGGTTEWQIRKSFGSYAAALHAAGFAHDAFHRAGTKEPQKFKYKRTQIQGFFVDAVDLEELFDRAGNPDVLKMVAQPDTHVPFHDEPALNAFLHFNEWYQSDVLINMGDFPDCNGISHWPANDFKPRRFVPEILEARKVLARIQDATPTVTSRYYIEGNHEDWLRQALVAKLPELMDGISELLPEGINIDLKTFLQLDKLGYEFHPLNNLLKIGKAHFTHGIYTNEHHAKKHLETFGKNIYYGHLHDTQSFNKTSVDGPIEAQSLGCLSLLNAPFMRGRPSRFQHAFGVFEMFPNGSYTFFKPYIFNGRFSFCGKVFDGNLSKAKKSGAR